MRHENWLAALTDELRRHGVGPDRQRTWWPRRPGTCATVAAAAAGLRSAAAYAAAVADSVGGPAASTALVVTGPVRLRARGHRQAVRAADGALRRRADRACGPGRGDRRRERLRQVDLAAASAPGWPAPDGGASSGTAGRLLPPGRRHGRLPARRRAFRADRRRAGRAAGHGAAGGPERRPRSTGWRAARQARHLSGGTRQKLNLVLAELGEPDVLLLDEPYQGFDRGTYLDFWHEVWRWRDAGGPSWWSPTCSTSSTGSTSCSTCRPDPGGGRMNRTVTIAEMTLRETARRRGVLVLLLALPFAFYLARRGDHLGQSIRFVCLGLAGR